MDHGNRKRWPADWMNGDGEPTKAATGIACPGCGCKRHRVVYVRDYGPGAKVRRRECLNCGRRFSTFEKLTG